MPPQSEASLSRGAAPALALRNVAFAVAILLAPLAFVVGAVLEPAVHVPSGAENIALNVAANPLANDLHIAGFVLASFLLPLSMIGMARLALSRSPWLATIGGGLGLVGWAPMAALAAQDDLTLQMARLGGGELLGTLWERFNADATMTLFLVTYIVGHLAAYVVLAIALHRAQVIPSWAAWLLALTTPFTLAFIGARNRSPIVALAFLAAFAVAFIVGSIPVALAALRSPRAEAVLEA